MEYKDHGNGIYIFKNDNKGYPILPAFADELSKILKEHSEFEVASILRDPDYICVVFRTK